MAQPRFVHSNAFDKACICFKLPDDAQCNSVGI